MIVRVNSGEIKSFQANYVLWRGIMDSVSRWEHIWSECVKSLDLWAHCIYF